MYGAVGSWVHGCVVDDGGAGGCVQVTGLLSQGRGEGSEWVTTFLVSYSLDAYHWLYITDQYGNQRVNTSFFSE